MMKKIFLKFLMLLVLLTCLGNMSIANNRVLSKSEIHIADSVVWVSKNGKISAHLYRDDLDSTRYYGPTSQELRKAREAYESSSYLRNDGILVREAFLKSLCVLSDNQVRVLLGDSHGWEKVLSIVLTLYKGKVVKTKYQFLEDHKIGDIPDEFILVADRNVRSIQFRGFEDYGIQYYFGYMFISCEDIQDHTGVKSDYQVFVENQETLWVLDGKVLRDTKGLTINMIDCSEPYVPLGKALDMEPGVFESLSVISGKEAAEKYGTKETAQVVEIRTKEYSKEHVSIEELALRMKRARLEKLGMGSKLDIDLKNIKEFVEKNPAAYKDLMDRFLKDPASLSKEEVANLYYGFAYTKDYDPLHVDLMIEPHKLYNEGKMQEAYDFCKKELQKAPVSLSLLWQISMIADELKMKEEAKKYYSTLKELYDAVTASGNGYSKENAIKVIFIADEYTIFRDMMGLKRLEQARMDGGYDRMTLDRGNKGETVTLWFDAHLSYDNYPKK